MAEGEIIIFTDGAAKGNPGPGGWGAIVATPDGTVTELGGGSQHTTNNKMELSAVIAALQGVAGTPGRVSLYTDSTYVIHGITQWIHGWRRKGWKTAEGKDVLNRSYWEQLWRLATGRSADDAVVWTYVPGHTGNPGNERADEIAVSFAAMEPTELYRGPLAGYAVDLDRRPAAGAPRRRPPDAPRQRGSSGGRGAAAGRPYSYLSAVGGQPMRHATWAECEKRVRGVSGARFKKAMSADDEAAILRAWGFRPEDV